MAGSTKPRVQALASPLGEAPAAPVRAKLVVLGRSQAVRLPKEFRLPGSEVLVRREGASLVLEPIGARGWPAGLWNRLDELAEGLDDDWKRPDDAVPRPIEQERELP